MVLFGSLSQPFSAANSRHNSDEKASGEHKFMLLIENLVHLKFDK